MLGSYKYTERKSCGGVNGLKENAHILLNDDGFAYMNLAA